MENEGKLSKAPNRTTRKLLTGLVFILLLQISSLPKARNATETIIAHFSNFEIRINVVEITPLTASGQIVKLFTRDGTTYLPVRAIAEALGMDVNWDGRTQTVFLDAKSDSDNLLT